MSFEEAGVAVGSLALGMLAMQMLVGAPAWPFVRNRRGALA